MKNTKRTLRSLLMAASILAAQGTRAEEGHGPEAGTGQVSEPSGQAAAVSGHVVMTAIYAHLEAIRKQLDSAKTEKIHEHALSIDSAAKGLDQDPKLDPPRKKRVQGYVKNIARISDAMHDAADGKKLAETRKAFGKLKAQVDLLDKQFAR